MNELAVIVEQVLCMYALSASWAIIYLLSLKHTYQQQLNLYKISGEQHGVLQKLTYFVSNKTSNLV